ncbi:hypothetical protein MtrunA17_Chr3g0124121 [Medicago truncatula]|uniref:Uncharacterized protein n=1 Tax=Medicago truncatula TaxID=3880 RepID=G7J3S6_MEDTR|nr:hypothetical protein MTR_3g087290 [Medicago truncatula]RHN69384.1 hypothetical protein MtrunA17_Chr3g0124121 [Medicago truncatula]
MSFYFNKRSHDTVIEQLESLHLPKSKMSFYYDKKVMTCGIALLKQAFSSTETCKISFYFDKGVLKSGIIS